MRITMVVQGTHGDVRPMVAFGRDLAAIGHRVSFATLSEFEPLVAANGLRFSPMSGDVRALAAEHQSSFESGRSLRAMIRLGREISARLVADWAPEMMAAGAGAELVIGGAAGALLAEKIKRPFVQVQLQPNSLFSDLPSTRLPVPRRALPRPVQRSLHVGLDLLAWYAMRPAVDGIVRRQLGLPAYGPRPPEWRMRRQGVKTLFGFSPLVVPPPRDAGARLTGFWFLDADPGWQPPAALAAFLRSGPPPIYVGFGSMPGRSAQRMVGLAVEAALAGGRRVLLSTGWGAGAGWSSAGDRLMVVEHVPHDWLFRHVSAVVHHGGAGTAASALRAGVPSITTPFLGDQHFWGWRLARLGVAAAPIGHKQATQAALRAAMAAADASPVRTAARDLGSRIAREAASVRAITAMRGWGLLPPGPLPPAGAGIVS